MQPHFATGQLVSFDALRIQRFLGNQAQAVRTRVRRGPMCDPHGIRPPLPVTMSETVASLGPVSGSALVVKKPSNRCAGVAASMPLTSSATTSATTKSAQPEQWVACRP